MALNTRQNPENGNLEVQVGEEWILFEEYRKKQIDDAYLNSIKFLRERLGEDSAKESQNSDASTETESNQ